MSATAYTMTGRTTSVGSSWTCPTCQRAGRRAAEVETHTTAGEYLGSVWLCERCAGRRHGDSIRTAMLRRQLTGPAPLELAFDVEIRDEAREGEPARHVVHIHATYPGPYLILSTVEARRLVAALTDALEEHDATRELELSIARLEARQRIGAGE